MVSLSSCLIDMIINEVEIAPHFFASGILLQTWWAYLENTNPTSYCSRGTYKYKQVVEHLAVGLN